SGQVGKHRYHPDISVALEGIGQEVDMPMGKSQSVESGIEFYVDRILPGPERFGLFQKFPQHLWGVQAGLQLSPDHFPKIGLQGMEDQNGDPYAGLPE